MSGIGCGGGTVRVRPRLGLGSDPDLVRAVLVPFVAGFEDLAGVEAGPALTLGVTGVSSCSGVGVCEASSRWIIIPNASRSCFSEEGGKARLYVKHFG